MLDIGDNYPIVKPVKLYTLGKSGFHKFLKSFKARHYRLTEDYSLYVPELKKEYFVPKSFVMNFASVPRIFWPICPPDGLLLIPSVFHDFGYEYRGLIFRYRDDSLGFVGSWLFKFMDRKEIDGFFEYLGKEVNDITIFPVTAYVILRAFGMFAWNKNRKDNKNVFADYPELDLYETI